MAATKFTAIYVNNTGNIIVREIPGRNTYKIAEKFAIMLNDPEETKLICVVETWKLYPKKMKKPKKIKKYVSDSFLFDTFKQLKEHIWYFIPKNTTKICYEIEEDVITKKYIFTKQERRLICEKTYDKDEEDLKDWNQKQLKLF